MDTDFVDQTMFSNTVNKNLSMDELVAQCVIFFLAGYETTATLLTYVLYCLALNGDVQEKAHQEIAQCLKEANGELTYEALRNMKYLDNVISGTLRLYPPAVRTERKVASEYKLGDTGIVLEKDMVVSIPIFALHRDPKYYPNPEKFDPERYSMRKQSYWKRRKIPYVKPLPFIGSLYDNMTTPIMELELKRHFALGPVYGHYEANRPLISIADPHLLRDIFVKDFAHFVNRRPFKSGDKISDKMISILEGEEWKKVRSIISPTFSTGKLKRVMSIFKDCSETLIQNFRIAAQKNEPVNSKRLFGAFTMDVIASSAFSTKIDSHNDPENEFVQAARRAFTPKFNWRLVLFLISPKILKLLNVSLADPSVNGFFSNVTTQIIEQRKRTKQKRNDFLQLLIDAAEEEDGIDKKEDTENEDDLASNYGQETNNQKVFTNGSPKSLTMNELIAQCIIFFLAGYDTTATALSFSSYLLATHQEVQERVRQEITDSLEETNGELTYESLNKMKYLDNIISETLRMYPPAVRTERKVESEYKLGEITLEKDMIVTIPIYALHHDPKYFPDPEKFDPDRFTTNERKERDSYSYLPFGHGPRNCVGMRFALMEIKVCLVRIISCFDIKICPQTKIPVEFRPNAFGLLQPQDILLSMELRDDCPLQIL